MTGVATGAGRNRARIGKLGPSNGESSLGICATPPSRSHTRRSSFGGRNPMGPSFGNDEASPGGWQPRLPVWHARCSVGATFDARVCAVDVRDLPASSRRLSHRDANCRPPVCTDGGSREATSNSGHDRGRGGSCCPFRLRDGGRAALSKWRLRGRELHPVRAACRLRPRLSAVHRYRRLERDPGQRRLDRRVLAGRTGHQES